MQLPTIQQISLKSIDPSLNISVLREDLVHPYLGGNKWRKLKYNLIDFQKSGCTELLTFGGAYSNHLVATATAGNLNGIRTIGIVRGEEISNPCLDYVRSQGMHLHFVTREEYRQKEDSSFVNELLITLKNNGVIEQTEKVFVVPEGGSNLAATFGAAEMNDYLGDAEHIFCPAGTGGTAAGITKRMQEGQLLHVVPVLKAEGFMEKNILRLEGFPRRIQFHYDYHFGGYAKITNELLQFCTDFRNETGIPVEPVYSGKMFFAFVSLAKSGFFKKESHIRLIHTGGVYPFYSDFRINKKKKVHY